MNYHHHHGIRTYPRGGGGHASGIRSYPRGGGDHASGIRSYPTGVVTTTTMVSSISFRVSFTSKFELTSRKWNFPQDNLPVSFLPNPGNDVICDIGTKSFRT